LSGLEAIGNNRINAKVLYFRQFRH